MGGRVEGALIIESLTMDYSRKYWNSQSSFPSISCEMGGDQNIPEYRTTDRVFHTDGGLPSPTLIKGGGNIFSVFSSLERFKGALLVKKHLLRFMLAKYVT